MVLQAPFAASATSTATTSLPSTSRTSSNAASSSTARVPVLKIKSSKSHSNFTTTIAAPMREAEEIAARFHLDTTISTLERLFSSSSSSYTFPPTPSDPPSSPRRRPPVRVAYQGVRGSYCQEAAALAFASSALSPSGSDLDSAFSALHLGAADRAVVPVENSLDGSIPRNLDLLLRHAATVQIVGEIVLPVNHCLLSLPGARIRRVVSHPQAISHCRRNLELLNLESVEEVQNAAEFANYLSENRIADTAVIGSAIAAREFGLEILHSNFQDKPGSFNRFLQLGLNSALPTSTGRRKTTVAFSLKNGPSDLFRAMWAFESRGVKVTRVEDRPNRKTPLRGGYFDYVYIIDLEGSKSDAAVRTGINRLGELTGFVQVLGSYGTN